MSCLRSNGGLEKIKQAYTSKHNSEGEHQVIFVMITEGEKWHYLSLETLSILLHRIKSKNKDDYYYMNSDQKINLNYMRICVRIIIIVTYKCLTHAISSLRIINLWRFHLLSTQAWNLCLKKYKHAIMIFILIKNKETYRKPVFVHGQTSID